MDKKILARIRKPQLAGFAAVVACVLSLAAAGTSLREASAFQARSVRNISPQAEKPLQILPRPGVLTTPTTPEASDKPEKQKAESVYTKMGFDECETTEVGRVDGVPYSVLVECEGVAGYKLEISDFDGRQTVNIITPDKEKHELRLNVVVSPSFSNTGETAEWRVVRKGDKTLPIALILRYIFTYNPAISSEKVSYLTVSKITDEGSCVTALVKPKKGQNEEARRLADSALEMPCLGRYSAYADEEPEL